MWHLPHLNLSVIEIFCLGKFGMLWLALKETLVTKELNNHLVGRQVVNPTFPEMGECTTTRNLVWLGSR